MRTRIVAHIDMDAFFAAIEERDHPHLAGLPIVVGADPMEGAGRGVVSTANYAAREYGIHSAMPISRAWQLSEKARMNGKPAATFRTGSFSTYGAVSERIMEIISRHASQMQQRSVDEAYCDLSDIPSFEEAEIICKAIQYDIFREEQLTASIGLGPNKLVAKIASDQHKPSGFTVVCPEEVKEFLAPLPVRSIPGIGPKTEMRLQRQNIRFVSDLQQWNSADLQQEFGNMGEWLYRKARGIDSSPVIEHHVAKSVGKQTTFMEDAHEAGQVMESMLELCARVHKRLFREGFTTYRTVVITVRYAGFATFTRSATAPHAQSTLRALQQHALRLLLPFFDARENPHHKNIRLIGVRVEKIG